MSTGGGGPEGPDAFSLDRLGRGRRSGGTALERRQGDTWIVVQRYPDHAAASRALDAATAEGRSSATEYRLATDDHRGVQRAVLVAAVVLAVLVAVSMWQIID